MLELILQLELYRERMRKKILPVVDSNGYNLIGTVLALIFASGTVGTAFVASPVSIPAGGASFVIFLVSGVIAILTIVLFPIGMILL